ncbi:hypothetical protein ACTXT7_007615 [Hymenolepis weldensis]
MEAITVEVVWKQQKLYTRIEQLKKLGSYTSPVFGAATDNSVESDYPPVFQKDMESIDAVNGTPAVITCHLNRSLTEKVRKSIVLLSYHN